MHSLSKTLFHVFGIFCLLVTVVLWVAALGDMKLLNQLVDKLANMRFAGYGLEIFDSEKRRIAVAMAGSSVGIYLTASFFTIGWLNGSTKALKAFSALTGCLLCVAFCVFWLKFLVRTSSGRFLTSSPKSNPVLAAIGFR